MTTAPAPTGPHPEGTLVRLLRDHDTLRAGDTFTVEDHVTADQADDGIGFYWGSTRDGFNNVTCPDGLVELAMTAEQMAARRPPTPEQAARAISGSLLGDHDGFDADETETDGDTVHIYATTPDGQRIAVHVQVIGVERVDF